MAKRKTWAVFGRRRSVRLQIDTDQMLVERAKKENMTPSRLIREILDDNLRYHKELEPHTIPPHLRK